jgi:hypothetical protein
MISPEDIVNEISSKTFTPEKLLVMFSTDKISPGLALTGDASGEKHFAGKKES